MVARPIVEGADVRVDQRAAAEEGPDEGDLLDEQLVRVGGEDGPRRLGQASGDLERRLGGPFAGLGGPLLTRLGTGPTLTTDERQNLAVIVAARTGLSLPEAEKRVAAVETDARAAAEQARRVGMMLSFWLAASLLAGALAASLAAWEGGAIRDGRLRY